MRQVLQVQHAVHGSQIPVLTSAEATPQFPTRCSPMLTVTCLIAMLQQ